jgi:aldose sugar dehydrogenase
MFAPFIVFGLRVSGPNHSVNKSRAALCPKSGDALKPPRHPTYKGVNMRRSVLGFLVSAGLSVGLAAGALAAPFTVKTVAEGLDHPWGLAFLPSGEVLVTERAGRLRIIRDGKLDPTPITGAPATHVRSQAGFFDVVLHPRFAENSFVYLVFAHGDRAANATRVNRYTFDGKALTNEKIIFTAAPAKDTSNHYGGRMAFLADGTFLLTVGDGFEYREKAQDLSSDLGKIVRLNDDGSVPADNPFVGQPSKRPEIWTYGHRNQQGLVVDPASGRVYSHEHGPKGGDELNLIAKGKNYGWPAICDCVDYTGAAVTPFKSLPGMEQAMAYWTPSIAPSGMTIYSGDKFPAWNGDLLVGALAFQHVRRVDLDANGKIVGQEEFNEGALKARIRDVRTSPDGYVYVTTDESAGKVLKLEPKP